MGFRCASGFPHPGVSEAPVQGGDLQSLEPSQLWATGIHFRLRSVRSVHADAGTESERWEFRGWSSQFALSDRRAALRPVCAEAYFLTVVEVKGQHKSERTDPRYTGTFSTLMKKRIQKMAISCGFAT